MKKVLLSVAAMAVLAATSAFATEQSSGIVVGIDHASFKDHSDGTKFSGNGINLGWESTKVYDNNFVFGYGVGMNYVNVDFGDNGSTGVYTFETDLKLGYSPIKNLAGYGIIGANWQHISFDTDPTNGGGFVYGAGVEYKFMDHVAANIEYKKEKIKGSGDLRDLTYDYATTNFNVKYIF